MKRGSARWKPVPGRAAFGAYLLIALCAGLLVFWSTSRYGIGVSSDSAHYIGAARSFTAGRGLEFNGAPFTHWPPLYPLLLASLHNFGADSMSTARLFAILLFAANALLVSWTACASTGGSSAAGIVAGLLILFSPEMVHIHTVAWSEPPFLFLTLLTIMFLSRWVSPPENRLLLPVSLCMGLAILTRFVGVTLLVPSLVCIAACRPGPASRRAGEMALVLLASLTPVGVWMFWCRKFGHTGDDRPLAFHPPSVGSTGWLWITMAGVASFALLLTYGSLKADIGADVPPEDKAVRQYWLLWPPVFIMVYIVFVLFSICFLDALTPLDARILSPVYPFGILAILTRAWNRHESPIPDNGTAAEMVVKKPAVAAPHASDNEAGGWWWNPASKLQWRVMVAGFVILVCVRAIGAIAIAKQRYDEGYGYTGRAWRESECLRWVESQPRDRVIFSNCPEVIAFRANRNAFLLPIRWSPTSLQHNPRLEEDLLALYVQLRRGAVVVDFFRSPRFYLVAPANVERQAHIRSLRRLQDGIVYSRPAR